MKRLREWWANPWGKPRFLVLFTVFYLAWSIVPILIAIRARAALPRNSPLTSSAK